MSAAAHDLFRIPGATPGVGRVHHAGCHVLRRSKHAYPWRWAEGKSWDEVFGKPWNVPCLFCFPGRGYAIGAAGLSGEGAHRMSADTIQNLWLLGLSIVLAFHYLSHRREP